MPVPSPDDLLGILRKHINSIRSNGALDGDARRVIADDLAEVYNYLSALHQKPSLERVIRSKHASEVRHAEQLQQERSLLNEHRDFVEKNIDKADQYLKSSLGDMRHSLLYGVLRTNHSTSTRPRGV